MINEELELKLNTSFDLPIDEIICNAKDYDDWDYLKEWGTSKHSQFTK